MDTTVSQYVKPTIQPALGGEEGLTSADIAQSLGVPEHRIVESLGKRGYADKLRQANCRLVANAINPSAIGGRPGVRWIMDTKAAQIFVAQTRTAMGIAYASYLIDVEAHWRREYPKLLARIEKLEADNRKRHKPRKPKNWNLTVGQMSVTDLFGEVRQIAIDKAMMINAMGPEELRQFRIQHLSRVGKGISTKLEDEALMKRKEHVTLVPKKSD